MVARNCDVERFRRKREEWYERLNGDDSHSIVNQLRQLTWDITVFRVLREMPFRNTDEVDSESQPNNVMTSLFDRLFASSVLMGFRRLVDGRHDVISLVSLLGDIRDSACLLRRDIILELGPVDEVGQAYMGTDFLADWRRSKSRMIDRLFESDVECPRKRIEDWRSRLKQDFNDVDYLVNKFIAHAATSTSRHRGHSEPPSYGELYAYHRELCQIAIFLQCLLTDTETISFLDVPLSDLWHGLSAPIIAQGDIPELERRWQQLAKEYDSWGNELPSIVR